MGRGEARAPAMLRLLCALSAVCAPCVALPLACGHASSGSAAPPGAPPTQITAAHNYAVHKLYLGDTDRTGIANPSAWASFGYNLDGLVTTAASTDVCSLVAGAAPATQQDGLGGVDNSFGENIVPILANIDGAFSASLNAAIEAGRLTFMTYAVGFDDSVGNTTTASGLTGVFLGGADYRSLHDAGPVWDLTTVWPVLSTSLDCPMTGCPPGTNPVTSASVQLPDAAQAGGRFVGAASNPVTVTLSIGGGSSLQLIIHAASITFDPDRPGAVTNGTIAGVLSAAELSASLQTGMPSLCSGDNFDSIAGQLVQASDIVLGSDGETVSNMAGRACNGISIGLGFDATEIALPAAGDILGRSGAGCSCGCD